MPPPVVLTVAGSDSGGGAGVQADLKTCEAHRVFGASVITSVTAQNTREVRRVTALSPTVVREQLEAVFDDLSIDAVKTGLLPSSEVVQVVGEVLRARGRPPLVVDPVLVATSGDALADGGVGGAILERLAPIATLLTPNLHEAAVLTGRRVETPEDMRAAARTLVQRGASAVLVKGGHLPGIPLDILLDDAGFEEYAGARIETGPVHGTGCTLSAAIASGLARGASLREAIGAAKHYVQRALAGAFAPGRGARVLDHGRATVD